MRYSSIILLLILVITGSVRAQSASARPPCGDDGSECECGEWGWQFTKNRFFVDDNNEVRWEYVHHEPCRDREECVRKYNEFVASSERYAATQREWADASRRGAEQAKKYGDKHWEADALAGLAKNLAGAKESTMEALHAVAPHCNLEKVAERAMEEFPDARSGRQTHGDWVIPPVRSENQVGVVSKVPLSQKEEPSTADPPFEISDRGKLALQEMHENWTRATALVGVTASVPILVPAVTSRNIDEWVINQKLFPWETWASTLEALEKHLTPFVKQRNRDIACGEFLYWSTGGRASNPERRVWGNMCRNM